MELVFLRVADPNLDLLTHTVNRHENGLWMVSPLPRNAFRRKKKYIKMTSTILDLQATLQ